MSSDRIHLYHGAYEEVREIRVAIQLAGRSSSIVLVPISACESLRAGKAIHPSEVNVEDVDCADDIAVPRSFASLADQNTVYFARHLCRCLDEFPLLVGLDGVAVLHAMVLGSVTAHARLG